MRLLRFDIYYNYGNGNPMPANLVFEEYPGDCVPSYAITSHRWTDDELTYDDIVNGTGTRKKGWEKLIGFCSAIYKLERNHPIRHVWIDTCCINKANSTELSEALNSMYRWYAEATICLAYLHDVRSLDELNLPEFNYAFRESEWFARGWTLQELLAPRMVVFHTKAWEPIGHKATAAAIYPGSTVSAVGLPINHFIAKATGIPEEVVWDTSRAANLSFEERQSWMKGRKTTRVEDMAYCQLGLYGVFLSPIYGEREEAYERLLEAIERKKQRQYRTANRAQTSSADGR